MNRLIVALLVSGVLLTPLDGLIAATLQKAELTRMLNDVRISPPEGTSRKARIGDVVQGKTAVKTGRKSRAELKFGDATLARLGANTVFSFERGTRDLELQNGLILLQVPKNVGGAKIRTAAVTAAITGTTIMLEYVPGVDGAPGYIKVIVLEGSMRFSLNGVLGESLLLEAGQMLILSPTAKSLPQPVTVDIGQLMATSGLAAGDFENLPSTGLIADVVATQTAAKEGGNLKKTNLGIFGRGTTVFVLSDSLINSLVNRSDGIAGALAGHVGGRDGAMGGEGPGGTPPTGTPPTGTTPTDRKVVVFELEKFGPPPLISGTYTIDELTKIITDPFVVRHNAGGDEVSKRKGTIYRNKAKDGALSKWLFGSTSSFDDFLGIDDVAGGHIAGFRFSDLEILGTPAIDTRDGPKRVALVAQNSIMAGASEEAETLQGAPNVSSGGAFNLAGLQGLVLATVDGGIVVNSGFTFTGTTQSLTLYARGSESYVDFYGDVFIPGGQVSLFSENGIYFGGNSQTSLFTAVAGDHFYMEQYATIQADDVYIDTLSSSGEGGIDIQGTITSAFQVLMSDGPIFLTGGILVGQDIGIEAESASLDGASITSTDNPGSSAGPGISIRTQGSINIQNSSQLLALATIAGTRRSIHLSTQGGDVTISGSTVRSDISQAAGGPSSEARIDIVSNGGAIDITNSTVEAVDGAVMIDTLSSTTKGIVSIMGSTIAGRDVKIRAAGPNGELLIGNSTISAGNLLELYANSTNGTVRFTGDTTLNYGTGTVSAHTVQVDNGVVVTANGSVPIGIIATDHNYSFSNGGNGSTTGTWAGPGAPSVPSF